MVEAPIIPCFIALLALLVFLGGGLSSFGLATVWIAQAALGAQILRRILGVSAFSGGVLFMFGPGYFVGFLTTTWLFMLLRGGSLSKISIYLLLIASLLVWARKSRGLQGDESETINIIPTLIGLTFLAMTWEFPELLISAVAFTALVVVTQVPRLGLRTRIALAAPSFAVFLWGISRRGSRWYLESDDLANRMAEGIVTVSRGMVASVGAYPFDQYHWVSPVATALQADLSRADLVFTFTVFSAVSSLVMLFASMGIIIRSIRASLPVNMTLLAVGLLFTLLWRVQINTEATVGRLAISITILSLFIQVVVDIRRKSLTRRGVLVLLVFAGLVGYMLLLYRPDLVVLMLLLSVGVVGSLIHAPRFPVLSFVAMSAFAVTLGVVAMRFALPMVSQSSVSYATLLIDWRPLDMGWCARGSTLRDFLCVTSLDINLWFALVVASLLVLRLRSVNPHLFNLWQLTVPLALSYFAFKFTLTSDFYSSIEGFFHLGLVVTLVFVLVTLAVQIVETSFREALKVVIAAVSISTVHTASRSGFSSLISEYPTAISDRLQGIMTPTLLEWSLASLVVAILSIAIYLAGYRFRLATALVVLLGACVANGVWIINKERPLHSDVNDALVANVLGPSDVFEVGRWLRDNTDKDDVIATNYQCRPGEFNRCSKTIAGETDVPWATANWMLMAESRREFLYLSQPFVDDPSYAQLHRISILPGTQTIPDFSELRSRGVDYFIAIREATLPDAWSIINDQAIFMTPNFAVMLLNSE